MELGRVENGVKSSLFCKRKLILSWASWLISISMISLRSNIMAMCNAVLHFLLTFAQLQYLTIYSVKLKNALVIPQATFRVICHFICQINQLHCAQRLNNASRMRWRQWWEIEVQVNQVTFISCFGHLAWVIKEVIFKLVFALGRVIRHYTIEQKQERAWKTLL